MLQPVRVKRRKQHRGKVRGKASRCNAVSFGEFGVQSLERGWITSRQIEAGRVACAHYLGGEGRLWTRVFPHKPVTAKPAEVRMGTGKGDVEEWVAVVRPGTVIFEVGGVAEAKAKVALNRIAHKLPVRVRLAKRRHKL
ncbi:MAG: 50S ribosomal protein L16 [Planctomycetes bacterium]|nr:50S ribosomal protein L16 [Planctomycetota bacterium]